MRQRALALAALFIDAKAAHRPHSEPLALSNAALISIHTAFDAPCTKSLREASPTTAALASQVLSNAPIGLTTRSPPTRQQRPCPVSRRQVRLDGSTFTGGV